MSPPTRTWRLPDDTEFDADRAQRAVNFFERMLTHTKGRWARKPFLLDDWQAGRCWQDEDGIWRTEGIIAPLMGAVVWDSEYQEYVRRYTLAWIEVARKNGKSEIMAALGLYLLLADHEEGAEIYGAASDRFQASFVFRVASRMIDLSPSLKRLRDKGKLRVIPSTKRIIYTPTDSLYQVVAADAAGNLGSNPHGILFDEVLTQPNRLLWDALKQGMGTRAQPLMVAVTTAGADETSFCFTEHEFGLRVAEDPNLDPSRFVYICTLPDTADPDKVLRDPELVKQANPGLREAHRPHSFLSLRTLRDEWNEARGKGDLSAIANFKQYRLNIWQPSATTWLDMGVWDESGERCGEFTEADIQNAGLVGYAGLDLAETDDFAAFVMLFQTPEGKTLMVPRFWLPRRAVTTKHAKIKPWIDRWELEGHVRVTDGGTIDYGVVTEDIVRDLSQFHVKVLGYDQWQAPAVIQQVEKQTKTQCIKVLQTTQRLSAPSKEFSRVMGARSLAHNGNPVLRWMAKHTAVKRDDEGHIRPSKTASGGKIDGIAAAVNAFAVLLLPPDDVPEVDYFYLDDDEEVEDLW